MNIKNILIDHYLQHPRAQILDMVKLLYQNEYAGGHMIKDESHSLLRLQEEIAQINNRNRNTVLYQNKTIESIGNGLCRINLACLTNININMNTLNQFFVQSSNKWIGSVVGFEEKLDILRECCAKKELPYEVDELELYLEEYKELGYPPVSHSDEYRLAYNPAYRVIREEYGRFLEVFFNIDQLLQKKDKVVIAIDGGSASGKSTLGTLIKEIYDCNLFHMDDYFLRPELRTTNRLAEIGGNVDYERFREEIVTGLEGHEAFSYQRFDCQQMKLSEPISVTQKQLNIVEGAYSLHPTLEKIYDFKVFLWIDEEEQSIRILNRNGSMMHKRFVEEWIPKENRYFEKFTIKEQCNLVYCNVTQ